MGKRVTWSEIKGRLKQGKESQLCSRKGKQEKGHLLPPPPPPFLPQAHSHHPPQPPSLPRPLAQLRAGPSPDGVWLSLRITHPARGFGFSSSCPPSRLPGGVETDPAQGSRPRGLLTPPPQPQRAPANAQWEKQDLGEQAGHGPPWGGTGPRPQLGWQQLSLAQTNSLGNKSLLLTSFLYLAENRAGAVGLNPFFFFLTSLPPFFCCLKKKF